MDIISTYQNRLIHNIPAQGKYDKDDLLLDDLLIARSNNLTVYYAPFDHINFQARIIIVGITPGWQQMEKAIRTFLSSLKGGNSIEEALRIVKSTASFAGSMRKNLITMLNSLLLNEKLGMISTVELFDNRMDLVHFTSVLKYPVFKNGDNYSGSSPNINQNKFLDTLIDRFFLPDIKQFSNSLIIPLGKKVNEALVRKEHSLNSNIILSGFPHPSGGNGHRRKQFEANREKLSKIIDHWSR